MRLSGSVHDQGVDFVVLEFLAAVKELEFDEEGNFEDFSAKLLNQSRRRRRGPAGGEEVIDEQDPAAGLEGVNVDGDRGAPVFEIIFLLVRLVRELPLFANGNEARLEFHGRGRSKDKAARIDTDDGIDSAGFDVVTQKVDAAAEQTRIRKHGCDVLELDAGFREVGDVANSAFDFSGSGPGLGHE